MKIAFLCGSLEPGRDGVGDYVRRLAAELAQQGHQITCIALNDQYVEQDSSVIEHAGANTLHILRIPALWPAPNRFELADKWIKEFDAEWLSLQFVPFSFHPKGLPFSLGKQLAKLGLGRRWHIMMHELWVGMDRDSPRKLVYWGKVQRYLITRLLRTLKPDVLHTQTALYQAQLIRLGFTSYLLPLFANIPNFCKNEQRHAERSINSTESIALVVFGTIHPGAPIAKFSQDAAAYAQRSGRSVVLQFVGRCGGELEKWVQVWQSAGLHTEVLGEQPAHMISAVLAKASLGLTTTPVALIGKSGTAAAMHEHGLPVICLTRPWIPMDVASPNVPAGVLAYSEGDFESCALASSLPMLFNRAHDIAKQLSNALAVNK
jgi:hypothetical protein